MLGSSPSQSVDAEVIQVLADVVGRMIPAGKLFVRVGHMKLLVHTLVNLGLTPNQVRS